MKFRPRGVNPPIITPLTPEREVDEEKLRQQVDFLLENGVHGIVAVGGTGEGVLLSDKEKRRVTSVVIDQVNGKVPVIMGTGDASTARAIELTKMAEDIGANGAMILTPYYVTPTEEGVYLNYKLIDDAVNIPMIVYNIPAVSKIYVTPTQLARIAELKNVAGVKDSSGNIVGLAECIKLVGDKISILTGMDDQLLQSFILGAAGCISAIANIFPREIVSLFHMVQKGNIEEAKKIYFKTLPIAKLIMNERNFPAQVKVALAAIGRPVGPTKPPLVPLTKAEEEEVKAAVEFVTAQ